MHNQIISTTGMDQESHIAQDNSYGNGNWADMSSYHHQTTMPDYGSNFGFMPPIINPLTSESLSRMPPPAPVQPMIQTHPSHPSLQSQGGHPTLQSQANHTSILPMLMPQHATWPSMLTNPPGPPGYGTLPPPPNVPLPPVMVPLKNSRLPALQTTPRKTLTDDDRRRMCQYAEDHPTAKQTDIGAMFGVERSTVSKVLRNKEKYLQKDPESGSPNKRKPRGTDIERALINFLRNAQRTGVAVTSDELKEKVRVFVQTAGSHVDSSIKANSSAWLDKFLQKHGFGPGKLMRRASETNIPDRIRGSPLLSSSQPSSAISPASPSAHPSAHQSAHPSPSPLSGSRSDEDRETTNNNFMDYSTESGAYKHSNSQSTTSLSSAFTDTATSSFSTPMSPTSAFNFSPDPNVGGFLPHDQNRQHPPPGGVNSSFQRPRSQTFPTLDLEYMNQPQTTEPLTPKYHVATSTAPSSALESPANEVQAQPFGLDRAISSPQLRHSSSSSSITARSTTTPITTSAVGSSPSSPTQEDARRAADTLLSFIQTASGFSVEHHEYLTVVRLTEKLRIHQTQQLAKAAIQGMGGLSRIPEGDSEMPNAPPPAPPIKVESQG